MSAHKNKYAIIFDFDGTIVDTEKAEYLAWHEIYKQHGFSLEASLWEKRIGIYGETAFNPLKYLQSLVEDTFDVELMQQKRRAILREYVEKLKPRAGVIELIEEAKAKDIYLGVASSAPRRWVEDNLARLDFIKYFDIIKCAEDAEKLKPDPELYNIVLKKLDVLPEAAIAIEDSPPGVMAAKSAGMTCIAVPCELSCTMDFSNADLLLESLDGLSISEISKFGLW